MTTRYTTQILDEWPFILPEGSSPPAGAIVTETAVLIPSPTLKPPLSGRGAARSGGQDVFRAGYLAILAWAMAVGLDSPYTSV